MKMRSEEIVPEFACDDKFGQEIKKYLGSSPLLYEENQKDYNQTTRLVIEQLRPQTYWRKSGSMTTCAGIGRSNV